MARRKYRRIRPALRAGHGGQHFFDQQADVIASAPAVFIRHFVRAEESGRQAQAAFRAQLAHHAQDLELGFERQPVAGFGFDGGGAAAQEPCAVAARRVEQFALRRPRACAARWSVSRRRARRFRHKWRLPRAPRIHPSGCRRRPGACEHPRSPAVRCGRPHRRPPHLLKPGARFPRGFPLSECARRAPPSAPSGTIAKLAHFPCPSAPAPARPA